MRIATNKGAILIMNMNELATTYIIWVVVNFAIFGIPFYLIAKKDGASKLTLLSLLIPKLSIVIFPVLLNVINNKKSDNK